jgi:hypothetical protein
MNAVSLEEWPRPCFEAGGGEPFLFYAIFGATTAGLQLSRSRYRCEGIPPGVEVHAYDQPSRSGMPDDFRSGHLWEELQHERPGLAAQIAAQDRCIVVRGALADAPTLNYLRDAIGLVTCLLDNGGVAVYDPLRFKWWSGPEWKQAVFEPAAPSPREHVVILASAEPDGTTWFHTRGLRKFGRPDLSIHDVPAPFGDAVIELFNRFIELQAFGGVIREGQPIRMSSLPAGMVCTHGGSEDDPDFNNVHVEVRWPADMPAPGRT